MKLDRNTSIIIVLCLWSLCNHLYAQNVVVKNVMKPGFSTLYSPFERIVENTSGIDTVRGEVYFMNPGKVHLNITYPLHQIMTIEGNITRIYYPELEKAFQLESKNPAIIPVVPGLIGATRPDYGLTDFGFQVYDQKLHGDTLLTFWSHPKAGDKIGHFEIAQHNDRLLYALYESPDSRSQTKTSFQDYISIDGVFFPTAMITKINSVYENATEKIFLHELKVNLTIPALITNFKIPEHVRIEKKEW